MRDLLLLTVFVGSSLAAQMSGYISDAACGWNNARAAKEAKECALKCVKGGWDPVFVRDGQMDAIKINDKAKVLPFVGDHVIIEAQRKGDKLVVKTIRRSTRGAVSPSKTRSPSAKH